MLTIGPESRQTLAEPQGTVVLRLESPTPVRVPPGDYSRTLLEEIAVDGTVYRIVIGPGWGMRFERENADGIEHASVNLAPLARVRVMTIAMGWAPGWVELNVLSPERPAVRLKGRSQ